MPNYKEITRLYLMGISRNEISRRVKSSKNTVSRVIKALNEHGYKSGCDFSVSEDELNRMFEMPAAVQSVPDVMYAMPDYSSLVNELKKPGVTMKLLWDEYCYDCRKTDQIPYRLTQFKHYFHENLLKTGFTDIIHHKPGEETEVDWAGSQPTWYDPDTGEMIEGYLFIGVLAFSGYTYAEACPDMKQESWINCHIHMFDYFQGITKILVPDNLKTGVIKHLKNEEPILNQSYQDMAEYYNIIILPARVRHPKEKPLAENTVNQCTKYIIAKLRNNKFFSIEEYNKQVMIELDGFNHKQYQKKPGSRADTYESIEKDQLLPLPQFPYEFAIWKKAKVAANSHISYEKKYYSVPFQYIGSEVDLKVTGKHISIYLNRILLCTHQHLQGYDGVYETFPEHMPPSSNAAAEWNEDRFIKWANDIGANTVQVITNLFAQYKYEQQGYNGAKSILMLSRKYSNERLENACCLALAHISSPRYKNIKAILENKQDELEQSSSKSTARDEHTFLRGSAYYKEDPNND